jgi:hypothetical protein
MDKVPQVSERSRVSNHGARARVSAGKHGMHVFGCPNARYFIPNTVTRARPRRTPAVSMLRLHVVTLKTAVAQPAHWWYIQHVSDSLRTEALHRLISTQLTIARTHVVLAQSFRSKGKLASASVELKAAKTACDSAAKHLLGSELAGEDRAELDAQLRLLQCLLEVQEQN